MQDWINKLKIWAIHKLGGYTPAECIIDPDRLKVVVLTEHYSKDDAERRVEYNIGMLESRTVGKLLESMRSFVRVECREDDIKREYTVRASVCVVDYRR